MGEGERFQTTCPMCRKPLFGVHDRLMLITTKGTYVCLAITLSKGLMDLSFAFMQSRYGWAVFYLMMLGFVLAFPIYAVLKFRAAGISATERLLPNDREPIRTRSQMRVSTNVCIICRYSFLECLARLSSVQLRLEHQKRMITLAGNTVNSALC